MNSQVYFSSGRYAGSNLSHGYLAICHMAVATLVLFASDLGFPLPFEGSSLYTVFALPK